MKSKCFLLLIFAWSVNSASLISKPHEIPVEVIYEEHPVFVRDLAPHSKPGHHARPAVEVIQARNIKNLDEKVQLSQEERSEALKHLPEIREVESKPEKEEVEKEKEPLLKQVSKIITDGLKQIRENLEKIDATKPTEEAWDSLNKAVNEILDNEEEAFDLKQGSTEAPNQSNQIVQNIINGFQSAANNFMQNFQQGNSVNGTEDEQQNQGIGGVFNAITNGFQQIGQQINNVNPQNSSPATVLGDTGVNPSTQGPNIITNVISGFQQIFSGGNQGNQAQSASLNQSDTGVDPTTSAPNFFQGAINQINQVVSNFRPGATPAPGSQGDEGTSPQPNPVQVIQQISSQIGTAIFGGNQNNPKPQGSEDEGSGTTQSTNFIQNIGQAIQNANPFRPQSTTGKPVVEPISGGDSSNPIQAGVQVVGNQIQQGFENVIAQISSTEASKKMEEPVKEMPVKVEEEKKPEVKPETKPKVKPEKKPEVKPEKKPEVKPEKKPEMKTEKKPEVKPETKPEVKPETKQPEDELEIMIMMEDKKTEKVQDEKKGEKVEKKEIMETME